MFERKTSIQTIMIIRPSQRLWAQKLTPQFQANFQAKFFSRQIFWRQNILFILTHRRVTAFVSSFCHTIFKSGGFVGTAS